MKIKGYEWRDGYHGKEDDAAEVAAEIERLREELEDSGAGCTLSEYIVKKSKPKRARLHSHFEWENSVAGRKWREEQARGLIRSVKVVYEVEDNVVHKVRVFHYIKDEDEGQTCKHVETILEDPDSREKLLKEAMRDLQRWRQKYATLTELAEVFATVDEFAA